MFLPSKTSKTPPINVPLAGWDNPVKHSKFSDDYSKAVSDRVFEAVDKVGGSSASKSVKQQAVENELKNIMIDLKNGVEFWK